MTDKEHVVRRTAHEFFRLIDEKLKGAEDYSVHEQILRRSGFLISYQAFYSEAYLIALGRLGKVYGDNLGHFPMWKTCLDILVAHPDVREFRNTMRIFVEMRTRANYEFRDFHEDWIDIEDILDRADRFMVALFEAVNPKA